MLRARRQLTLITNHLLVANFHLKKISILICILASIVT